MFQGEPIEDTMPYSVQSDGFLYMGDFYGAISNDGRYFMTVDIVDSSSIAAGFGIKGEDPALAIDGFEHGTLVKD
jgi:hypothetical protein